MVKEVKRVVTSSICCVCVGGVGVGQGKWY